MKIVLIFLKGPTLKVDYILLKEFFYSNDLLLESIILSSFFCRY